MGTRMSTEYAISEQSFGWEVHDFRDANLNALVGSFVPSQIKSVLANEIIAAYIQGVLTPDGIG